MEGEATVVCRRGECRERLQWCVVVAVMMERGGH